MPPEPEDPARWQLSVGGEEARSTSLTLEDLKTKWVLTSGYSRLCGQGDVFENDADHSIRWNKLANGASQ